MVKILTVCSQGLVRSVGLADVLKLHFEPVDVIPVGYSENANSAETLRMLCDWADHVIFMQPPMRKRVESRLGIEDLRENCAVHCCDVGRDTYGGDHGRRRELIDKVWQWTRENQDKLGISEHKKRL